MGGFYEVEKKINFLTVNFFAQNFWPLFIFEIFLLPPPKADPRISQTQRIASRAFFRAAELLGKSPAIPDSLIDIFITNPVSMLGCIVRFEVGLLPFCPYFGYKI